MIGLYCLTFLAMAGGVFLLLGLTPFQFISSISKVLPKRRVKMKKQIRHSISPKRPRGIKKIVLDAKNALAMTNRKNKFITLCSASFALAVVGAVIGSLLCNIFLIPVMAVGLSLLPFLYILLSLFRFKKRLNAELETDLSMVTAEYEQSEDIVAAIQATVGFCRLPVRETFREFISNVTSVNADVETALEIMKTRIDNNVFREWVDALILCQQDRTLKSTLEPIVRKFSEMRWVSGELNLELYTPIQMFLIMALALFSTVPLLSGMNADWGYILMHTQQGQFTLAVDMAVFFFSLIRVVQLTRPIEFRR